MKFACDRCKTRYSIGDDRVRGKILKIRCKSCANVITVREGMASPDPEPAPAGPRRGHKSTTAAPVAHAEAPAAPPAPAPVAPAPAAPAPAGALGAAFASAMAKPPPALEEEWYVSLDGDQAGPFALADAQRWIADQAFEAELFCWSEGFDDWLPVDKVSHFRGLRKKPAPAPTPPVPARPPVPLRSATAMMAGGLPRSEPTEDTPRPLFAATMAQLEQGAAPSELRGAPAPAPRPVPSNGQLPAAAPPHANGAAALTARAGLPAPLPSHVPTQLGVPGVAARPSVRGFDAGGDASSTQVDALPFDARAEAAATMPARAPAPADPGDGDDDLDIGEVSRVVKLADLARDAARRPPQHTPPVAVPLVARAAGVAPGPFPSGPADAFPAPELASPAVVASHRRALIALISGALVLVGVAVAVVFFVLTGGEDETGRLAKVEEIDTTRPDEIRPTGSGGSAEAATLERPSNPFGPRLPRRPALAPPVGPTVPAEPAGGTRLDAQEIEDMAGKNSSVTQRCFMRAQRGVDGILLGDVKKIAVTLTINGEGLVTEAQLSDNHAQDSLGKCLIAAIRTWKFRASPGGTFRFVLQLG